MTNFEFCRGSIHSKTTESCLLLFLCTLGSTEVGILPRSSDTRYQTEHPPFPEDDVRQSGMQPVGQDKKTLG